MGWTCPDVERKRATTKKIFGRASQQARSTVEEGEKEPAAPGVYVWSGRKPIWGK